MMDHYLSEIEVDMKNGLAPKQALFKAIEKINKADFKSFTPNKYSNNIMAAFFILLFACSSAFYILTPESEHFHYDFESITEVPDGWPLLKKEKNIQFCLWDEKASN